MSIFTIFRFNEKKNGHKLYYFSRLPLVSVTIYFCFTGLTFYIGGYTSLGSRGCIHSGFSSRLQVSCLFPQCTVRTTSHHWKEQNSKYLVVFFLHLLKLKTRNLIVAWLLTNLQLKYFSLLLLET